MKITIITLQNVRNYGSVLQALATQHVFEEMGMEVDFNTVNQVLESERIKGLNYLKKALDMKVKPLQNVWRGASHTLNRRTIFVVMQLNGERRAA